MNLLYRRESAKRWEVRCALTRLKGVATRGLPRPTVGLGVHDLLTFDHRSEHACVLYLYRRIIYTRASRAPCVTLTVARVSPHLVTL